MARIVLKNGEVLELEHEEMLKFIEEHPNQIQTHTKQRKGPRGQP